LAPLDFRDEALDVGWYQNVVSTKREPAGEEQPELGPAFAFHGDAVEAVIGGDDVESGERGVIPALAQIETEDEFGVEQFHMPFPKKGW
jgi:hypothetical protein